MSCERCIDPDGIPCFPQYGPAPHVHVPHESGAFMIKQDIPRDQWSGFTEDPEWPGFGTHWCPYCGDGKPEQQGGGA